MNSTKSIIAIDCNRLDSFALSIGCKSWPMLNRHFKVSHIFDTDELVEAKLFFLHLILIVLLNTRCVNGATRRLAKLEKLLILFLLWFEFRHNE